MASDVAAVTVPSTLIRYPFMGRFLSVTAPGSVTLGSTRMRFSVWPTPAPVARRP